MTNILNNRVSATLTAEQIADVKASLQKVRDTLPFLIGLTNDERQSLPKMSTVNRGFTDDALNAMSNNANMFPAYLDSIELRKDLQLYDQMDELVTLANQVCELLRDTQMLAGSEAYVTALTGYKLVSAAATGGVPGAKTVHDMLKKRFEGQGGSADLGDTPPAPPAA